MAPPSYRLQSKEAIPSINISLDGNQTTNNEVQFVANTRITGGGTINLSIVCNDQGEFDSIINYLRSRINL